MGTPSGRVVVACEKDRGMIEYSYTDDGGATWEGPFTPDTEGNDVYDANQPDLAVSPSGDIWLIYNAYVKGPGKEGWGLWSQVSSDDGATWSGAERLQDGYCCQRIAGTPEGLVLAWHQGKGVGAPFDYLLE